MSSAASSLSLTFSISILRLLFWKDYEALYELFWLTERSEEPYGFRTLLILGPFRLVADSSSLPEDSIFPEDSYTAGSITGLLGATSISERMLSPNA